MAHSDSNKHHIKRETDKDTIDINPRWSFVGNIAIFLSLSLSHKQTHKLQSNSYLTLCPIIIISISVFERLFHTYHILFQLVAHADIAL